MTTPTRASLFTFSLVSLAIACAGSASAASLEGALLPEGTLIIAPSDPRVYYVEGNTRRWIDSEEAFLNQGFKWNEILKISDEDFSKYQEGAPLTPTSRVSLPSERATLPDLSPFPAEDIHLSRENGRLVIRFTTTFWNQGGSLFDLVAHTGTEMGTMEAHDMEDGETLHTVQHILRADGSSRDKFVGNFIWHAPHNHYHYEQFAYYSLELMKPAPGAVLNEKTAVTQKTTFCMRDDRLIAPHLPGSPDRRVFSACGKTRQGVSVGWADVYPSTLPDQFIDVTDMPAGVYKLSFLIDPLGRFIEKRSDNNESVALVDIDPSKGTMRIVARGSAFTTNENLYPNNMLMRREGESDVFVMRNGKKRWIKNEAAFNSYGFKAEDVYEIPAGIVNAIPQDRFVRQTGTGNVYMLNEGGYVRRILNPDVLASYGADGKDVAEVSSLEFASYLETDLMKTGDSDQVYSVYEKRPVGKMSELAGLGIDVKKVQTVTAQDLQAYTVQVVATAMDVPWDIAFLPDGDMLVTERPGTLHRLGAHPTVIAIPSVHSVGEGGLMSIALHPDFARNNLVYLYFTSVDGGQHNRVVRFKLSGNALVDEQIIVDDIPSAIYHDGGGLAFGPDGMMYLTTGDANNTALAQDLTSLAGKTLRFTPEGGIPSDNPIPGNAVWSYGHRNAQGITWDSQGRIWETEHGRSGATSGMDEVNLITKGANYGWPTIQGSQTHEGMVTPVANSGAAVTWAPSGLAFADGRLFFAGLKGETLYSAAVNADGTLGALKSYFVGSYGRLRAVTLGPDGFLYVTTSNRDGRGTPKAGDDKILKIRPEFLR